MSLFKPLHRLGNQEKGISSVKFSPSGDFMATSSADNSVTLWNSKHLSKIHLNSTLGAHAKGINDVFWAPNSKILCSVSDDCTAKIWDIEQRKCLGTLEDHSSIVFSGCFNAKGNLLATVSFDETLRLWAVQNGKCCSTINAHSDPVVSVDFCMDSTLLATGSYDGLCRLWDAETGQCLKTLEGNVMNPPVSFVKFSPNGRYLLTFALDSTIHLWDYVSGKYAPSSVVCTFFVDEKTKNVYVVSGSEDNCLYVWDLQTQKLVSRLEAHNDVPLAVTSHPSLPVIASSGSSQDKSVIIWTFDG